MTPHVLMTQSVKLRKARGTNQTSTSFVSKVPTATEPLDIGDTAGAASATLGSSFWAKGTQHGSESQNSLFIKPYGIGNDDTTMSFRVVIWSRVGDNPETMLWDPTVIAEFSCTLSTVTGVAGKEVLNTERFADAITLVTGNDDVDVSITSPGSNVAAHVVIDFKGGEKVEITFSTGSSATSCNALIRTL